MKQIFLGSSSKIIYSFCIIFIFLSCTSGEETEETTPMEIIEPPLLDLTVANDKSTIEIRDVIQFTVKVEDENGIIESVQILINDELLVEDFPNISNYDVEQSIKTAGMELGNVSITINATNNFEETSTKTVDIELIERTKDIERGLVAYYPFNGNTKDESGFCNDGIPTNGSFWTDKFGVEDGALHLNDFLGEDEYVTIPATENNNLGTKDFTLSIWFQVFAGTFTTILSKRDVTQCQPGSQVDTHFRITYDREIAYSGTPRVAFDGRMDLDYGVGFSHLFDGIEWHRLTIVREGELFHSYFDDLPKVTRDHLPLLDLSTSQDLMIGGDLDCVDLKGFTGVLDELRIYDRALSDEEVSKLWY